MLPLEDDELSMTELELGEWVGEPSTLLDVGR